MSDTGRVIPAIAAHFIVGFLLALIYTFNQPLPGTLLESFILSYRIRSTVLVFIHALPSLYISSLLIGFTIAFSKIADINVGRWSSQLLGVLKSSFVIMVIVIAAYVVLTEGVAPIMHTKTSSALARSDDYREYLRLANDMLRKGQPRSAEKQVLSALEIWKESAAAQKLLDDCHYSIADLYGSPESTAHVPVPDPLVPKEIGALTVLDAIDSSEGAARELDYYNAHYYAMLAFRLSRPNDPNRELSLRMAADAWNHITTGTDFLRSRDDARLYDAKRTGYNAIQQGDYLTAYYEFLELYTEDSSRQDGKRDPDLERFLEVSRKGVLESFFFLDETAVLRPFESARDVFFVIKRQDGGLDAVYARGVVYTRNGGKDVVYIRDFELLRHNQFNQLEYHIRVPNVKMFAYTPDGKNPRAELMLQSVDRTGERKKQVPAVLAGNPAEQDISVLLLDMPYRDFNLIVSANRGPDSMNMVELLRFYDHAENYGFDQRVYLREAIARLSEPFLLLIISVLALIAGWKYRLGKNVLFKAWWVLVVPLFPIVAMFIIQSVRYLAGLCIAYFVITVPELAMVFTLLFLAVCFTGASLYFFAQRSD
ncbi:MAG TPA: hypothetical protein GXZ47_02230 [Treponema sp.]|nr:hypothetical protein [Treponema sp.]